MVVATSGGGCSGTLASRKPSPPPSRVTTIPAPSNIAVDTAATPLGWVPVDDGDAQLSVPANWSLTLGSCVSPTAAGTIMLKGQVQSGFVFGAVPPCFPTETAAARTSPVVQVGPIGPSAPTAGAPLVVHGIVVDVTGTACALSGPCPSWYVVPSLGVEIVVDEVPGTPSHVINTLTESPRAVALARGPAPAVLARWHRVSFGGISVAVPAAWSIQHTSNWSAGCGQSDLVMYEPGVILDSGATDHAPSCAAVGVGGEPPQAPDNGVLIDPGRYGPLSSATTFARCTEIHELNVCLSASDPYSILVVAVHLRGRTGAVAVEIGLAGTGMTGRTILGSLRDA